MRTFGSDSTSISEQRGWSGSGDAGKRSWQKKKKCSPAGLPVFWRSVSMTSLAESLNSKTRIGAVPYWSDAIRLKN